MELNRKHLNSFNVMGISCRTINKDGHSGKDISELWDRFYKENILSKIPGKKSNDIYNVYTDYESDHNGYYITILGCKVKSLDAIPAGLMGKHIHAAQYNIYVSNGKLPDCVLNTWQDIWQSAVERSYTSDFDLYSESMDWENARVETYLSVK
jgi:predicted transcriptional regulator YdeE